MDHFTFLDEFDLDKSEELNGLVFNGLYVPKEILLEILCNLRCQDILKCSLVCKTWFNLTRCKALWKSMYCKRECPKEVPNLPWYVFYCHLSTDNFRNLIKNGNGELKFKHWEILENNGDKFAVEPVPVGCDPLPSAPPEFHGHQSCFVTSYGCCAKYQKFDISSRHLLSFIVRKYHPTLYASEWYSGRFDCSCTYKLILTCVPKSEKWIPGKLETIRRILNVNFRPIMNSPSWPYMKSVTGSAGQQNHQYWEKKEIFYTDYPEDLWCICFLHAGKDEQFWKGHYGSKMAGGVLKFVFESIKPCPEDLSTDEL